MRLDWTHTLPHEQNHPFQANAGLTGWRTPSFKAGRIAACFGLVIWPVIAFTVTIALLVPGGRQPRLGILMHESRRRSLFKTACLSEGLGQWLCAEPICVACIDRQYRYTHHQQPGTADGAGLPNHEHYPVSRASQLCKLLRTCRRSLVAKLTMFGVCVSTGHLLIYLPGPAAWLTSDMPAAVNYVNHNFLHHLLPTVPAIQMARFRRWLRVEAQHNAAAVLKVVDATVPKCMVSVSHAGGDPYHDY